MESHRLKDDEESVRAALSSLKTATGIPVTMYATPVSYTHLTLPTKA